MKGNIYDNTIQPVQYFQRFVKPLGFVITCPKIRREGSREEAVHSMSKVVKGAQGASLSATSPFVGAFKGFLTRRGPQSVWRCFVMPFAFVISRTHARERRRAARPKPLSALVWLNGEPQCSFPLGRLDVGFEISTEACFFGIVTKQIQWQVS